MSGHELVDACIYGPVVSRRFGASLGINPLPAGRKVCGFNCNYCQLGWTTDLVDEATLAGYDWPSAERIARELGERLRELAASGTGVERITFSGNGEPTLHPDFDGVVMEVLAVRDREAPGVAVGILTNGALLSNPRVVGGLNLLDERYVKLDAGTESMFLDMNCPTVDVGIWDVIQGIGRLKDCVIQAMFTRGRRDNTAEADVDAWIAVVGRLNPKAVQIYTVSRTPADPMIRPVESDRLEEIARRLRERTGIETTVHRA